jgi:cellulose synthase (UDP-forming)
VDIFVPTYNEDLNVVKNTIYASQGIDWPKDKLNIWILDDGGREAFRQFAKDVGVHYIARTSHEHAKAGNINNALKYAKGEFVSIFDCDHVPTRSFLQMTMGWFLKEKELAMMQTPHHFFSPDPFERNLGRFAKRRTKGRCSTAWCRTGTTCGTPPSSAAPARLSAAARWMRLAVSPSKR